MVLNWWMAIHCETPQVSALPPLLNELGAWQPKSGPILLHPGDIGWFERFGAEATANAVPVWRRDGVPLAIGLKDGDDLLRLAIRPDMYLDPVLAHQIAHDLAETDAVLAGGTAYLELPLESLLRGLLIENGWILDDPWTHMRHNLEALQPPTLRITVNDEASAADQAAILNNAFGGKHSVKRWRAMASGPAFSAARCLVAYDDAAHPVATITVWSGGDGKPGLIEPLATHSDFRGQGYGRQVIHAGLLALQNLGASSAIVATPSSSTGGVAAYQAAGFDVVAKVPDLKRDF